MTAGQHQLSHPTARRMVALQPRRNLSAVPLASAVRRNVPGTLQPELEHTSRNIPIHFWLPCRQRGNDAKGIRLQGTADPFARAAPSARTSHAGQSNTE
eukprot:775153-Pleurochrysis_carterae.AAC.1